ncbi:hypothetical protein Y1Q_0003011 [Alligator mississippiensis]|uniref:Uncharacterized protein n=1 Tax=Alligator mississippiensis TaxID=8496 RepID=A0A151MD40_ALLMI|nr:hypothetical protein Y1Q_0003011 [Alligator mississippiensis]
MPTLSKSIPGGFITRCNDMDDFTSGRDRGYVEPGGGHVRRAGLAARREEAAEALLRLPGDQGGAGRLHH